MKVEVSCLCTYQVAAATRAYRLAFPVAAPHYLSQVPWDENWKPVWFFAGFSPRAACTRPDPAAVRTAPARRALTSRGCCQPALGAGRGHGARRRGQSRSRPRGRASASCRSLPWLSAASARRVRAPAYAGWVCARVSERVDSLLWGTVSSATFGTVLLLLWQYTAFQITQHHRYRWLFPTDLPELWFSQECLYVQSVRVGPWAVLSAW